MSAINSLKAKAISVAVNKGFCCIPRRLRRQKPSQVESMVNKFAGSGDKINDAQLRLFNMVMGYAEGSGA